jgi:predicted PurR-regulated permease PerM
MQYPIVWRVLAVLLLLVLAWLLRDVAMVLFGAVLFAAMLRALARPVARFTGLPSKVVTALTLLLLLLLTAVGLWSLGEPLAEQLQALRFALPRAWQALQNWLSGMATGQRLLDLTQQWQAEDVPWLGIAGLAGQAAGAIGALGLIVLLGVYLAFDVRLYRDGLVRLFPPPRRSAIGDALDAAGHALTRWLLGQAVTMLVIGVAVAAGLSLLGMPLALALGVIAGLLNFVPFFGPIISGLLAVLIAFSLGPTQALYVALLFVVLQQFEGSLLVPLIQRWTVSLPPVLGLLAVVVFGALFGVSGVVLGTPLMVVIVVLVKQLYIEGLLEGRAGE